MRPIAILAIVSLCIPLVACTVGGDPEIDCDEVDDDATCTCQDGSQGQIICTEQLLDCVCDGEPTWWNSVPVDAGRDDLDAGEDDAGEEDAGEDDAGDDAGADDVGDDTGDAGTDDVGEDDADDDDAGDAGRDDTGDAGADDAT